MMELQQIVQYVPIATTLFAIYFTKEIWQHWRERRTTYLMWWTIGVVTFALGTLAESIHALAGWHPLNVRLWYIVGALLGGFPLAQGSAYLLASRRFADTATIVAVSLIVVASIAVMLTPFAIPADFDYRLTGRVFEWQWVRWFSPFINIYSLIFLVGGAFYSAWRYYRSGLREALMMGNVLIAVGGLLPGIGGTFTRMGYVEVLFVTELVGLLLIYAGYKVIRNDKRRSGRHGSVDEVVGAEPVAAGGPPPV